MKIFAIDYDDTYTADPELWDLFVKAAKDRGHMVVCVTYRDKEKHGACQIPGVETFYTSGTPKAAYMLEQGVTPSIWCDDRPDLIGKYF